MDFYLFFHLTLPTGGQGGYPEGRQEVRQWNMGGVRQSVHGHCLTPSGSKKCGAHPPKRPRIAKCKNLKIWILGIFNFGIFGSLRCGRHPLHGSPPPCTGGHPRKFQKEVDTPRGFKGAREGCGLCQTATITIFVVVETSRRRLGQSISRRKDRRKAHLSRRHVVADYGVKIQLTYALSRVPSSLSL